VVRHCIIGRQFGGVSCGVCIDWLDRMNLMEVLLNPTVLFWLIFAGVLLVADLAGWTK
jgi:hypothetical protein